MSQHRPHASATPYEDESASSNVRLRAHSNASPPHQQPTPPASKGPSRSSPTRSSPSRGSRARPSAPPPGLYSRPHRAQPPYSAATATSSWVGARGREYTDALGEPVDASNTASKHVAEGTRPLRDESSFIDNFFASGETVLVAPAALRPDAQVEDATSDVNHHRDEETGGAMTDSDVLGVRVPGVGHASTSTSASSDAAGTPTRTQSRFSSWFHEPAQEDPERDGLTVTGWDNRKAQFPSVTPESGSWRRRPSDPPRREERPADNTKSWRRGPPGVMPAEPVVRGASSSLGHSATRPAIGKEKDQQRKPPRPRDRGRDEPEDKKKKDGSSRRSVAPPPGFASAGEQKRISPPPGFGQDLAIAKESQPADSPTAVPSPLHRDSSQDATETMASQHDVDHISAVAKTSNSGSIPTDHPQQPEVGSLLGSAAPHISAPPLQASAPSVSASNPRTRSLKNYLPAARSNAKSLPSLAATLPLSFSASTSAASSPFPPLGQQQPFSAPLATLSPPPHFLSAPLRPGLAPPHSSGLLGSMHHTDGGPFPLARLSGAYTAEYANGLQSLTYAPRPDKGQPLGQE